MEEVAKHNKKGDVWVVLDGHLLFQISCLSIPAQLAILTFAGKDAAAEFDMTHPRDLVEKYLSDPVIGVVGSGKAEMVRGAAFDDEPGVLLVNVRSHGDACCLLIEHHPRDLCHDILCEETQDFQRPKWSHPKCCVLDFRYLGPRRRTSSCVQGSLQMECLWAFIFGTVSLFFSSVLFLYFV